MADGFPQVYFLFLKWSDLEKWIYNNERIVPATQHKNVPPGYATLKWPIIRWHFRFPVIQRFTSLIPRLERKILLAKRDQISLMFPHRRDTFYKLCCCRLTMYHRIAPSARTLPSFPFYFRDHLFGASVLSVPVGEVSTPKCFSHPPVDPW